MKRNEIKAIVKECLLEILLEGVGSKSPQPSNFPVRDNRQDQREAPPRRRALDYIVPNASQQSKITNHQSRVSEGARDRNLEVAKNIVPNDPVMASIFADTASTTLQEQVSAESNRGSPVRDTGVDPMSLFENAGNWAALAFSEFPAKRS